MEIPSGSRSEEEVVENRELWTHVVHDDREPAPYAHSEMDEEPDVAEISSESNHETQEKVRG